MTGRVKRVAAGLAATALCLLAGACAPDDASPGGASPGGGVDGGGVGRVSPNSGSMYGSPPSSGTSGAVTSGPPPAEAPPLAGIALKSGELRGYAVAPLRYEDVRGTERSEDPACAPLAGLINGAPEPTPTAAELRTVVDTSRAGRDDQTVVTLLLASYAGDRAESLLGRLRRAVTACADGFRTRGDDGPATYTAVTALPAPLAGQEALAYRVMCASGEGRTPLVFTVVRGGTVVAVFGAANYLDGEVPEIPAALVAAQAGKLPRA